MRGRMRNRQIALILMCGVVAPALFACAARPLTVEESGWALAIADRYGARAWNTSRTRYLRYDVVVARDGMAPVRFREFLDRGTGDYRFEADASEFGDVIGMPDLPPGRLVALGNRELLVGNVWIDQTLQPPSIIRAVRERLDYDSWWITFPLDLGNPDLHVEDRGPVTTGESPDSSHLLVRFPAGFRNVYHLHVDPTSLLILRTEIEFPEGPSEVATWDGPIGLNGIRVQLLRRLSDRTLRFENIALNSGVRSATLRDPEAEMHDAR